MKKLFCGLLANVDLLISGLSLAGLVGLTAVGVVMRYVLRDPITWMEEAQTLLFVWAAFFGAGVAFRLGGHVSIEAVVELFPVRFQRILEVVDSLLVALILVLVMYWELIRGLTLTRTGRSTSILDIPLSLNYFGVSASCLLMLIHFIRRRLELFGSWRREADAAKEAGHA
ncbi:MAG: TRAP transporter small permease [Planctomycetota bacterium]|jgi:TRAP-type C4-dicarboxylate transport system permease small subunit|nr:TRAP transporter small permease [Planctomycetota bacterium]